jgi:hypothetical protein
MVMSMFPRKKSACPNKHLADCVKYHHPVYYLTALFLTLLPKLTIACAMGYAIYTNADKWMMNVSELVKSVFS